MERDAGMNKTESGNLMQILRERLGLTCSRMAKDTGYSVHSVRNMLGAKGSTDNFIRKVCEVYHVDERWFRGEISLDEALEHEFAAGKRVDYNAVGKRIRDRRMKLGMSATKLAEKAGCSRVLITKAEKGEEITEKTLKKVAAALDVTAEYLRSGKTIEPVTEEMIRYLNRNDTLRRAIAAMMREEGIEPSGL